MESPEISAPWLRRAGGPAMKCFFCSPMPVISESELVADSLLFEQSDCRTSRVPEITNSIFLTLEMQDNP